MKNLPSYLVAALVLTASNGGLAKVTQPDGSTAYDEATRVPLLFHGPFFRARRVDFAVSLIDLAPTFEELAGLTPAAYRSGTSLVPTLGDRRRVTRTHVFHEHTSHVMGGDPDLAFTGGELMRIPSSVATVSK